MINIAPYSSSLIKEYRNIMEALCLRLQFPEMKSFKLVEIERDIFGFPGGMMVKHLPASAGHMRAVGSISGKK